MLFTTSLLQPENSAPAAGEICEDAKTKHWDIPDHPEFQQVGQGYNIKNLIGVYES